MECASGVYHDGIVGKRRKTSGCFALNDVWNAEKQSKQLKVDTRKDEIGPSAWNEIVDWAVKSVIYNVITTCMTIATYESFTVFSMYLLHWTINFLKRMDSKSFQGKLSSNIFMKNCTCLDKNLNQSARKSQTRISKYLVKLNKLNFIPAIALFRNERIEWNSKLWWSCFWKKTTDMSNLSNVRTCNFTSFEMVCELRLD